MGRQDTSGQSDSVAYRDFMRAILRDLQALERMLEGGEVESSPIRIGAEQELFIVDESFRPAPLAAELLEACKDQPVTPELAKFNIEINAPPYEFTGTCLSDLETGMLDDVAKVRAAARKLDADVVMIGVLPTLTLSDLSADNMFDSPRYRAIDETLNRLRGGNGYELNLQGTDQLVIRHDSMMVESCNTSFQVHLQVAPADFTRSYNLSQLLAGPVLACATNSPLLFGKRLWRETRIALFEQTMDARRRESHDRDSYSRVIFGTRWLDGSMLALMQEDISRFRLLITAEDVEDPRAALAVGRPPKLDALRLHNGTVYRWMRPCYGILDGKPHLRIENRVLPSGPTVLDEVANASFWLGAMIGAADEYGDPAGQVPFDEVKTNFLAASKFGLGAQFTWIGGEQIPAQTLILERLLPLARQGLEKQKVVAKDIDLYLGVVEKRVRSGLTGSQWLLSAHETMSGRGTRGERLAAITAGAIARQEENVPVSEWSLAELTEGGGWTTNCRRVDQYMTTDLFTVKPDDIVDLVASMMDWNNIRHVPVEDDEHRLVGLVSQRNILRLIARGWQDEDKERSVSDIMISKLETVAPETTTQDAVRLMRERKVSCLPVVKEGRLVGIVSESDFVRIAAPLFDEALTGKD